MITLGIKHKNFKNEVELLAMIYKKLSSKIVWDIILTLLDEYKEIALTETEIAKKLNMSASNLSPHINFLLAINLLSSEDGNREQLTKGSKLHINELSMNKEGYTEIISQKFNNMSPEEFKKHFYPKRRNQKIFKDCQSYTQCKQSQDKKYWNCENCKFYIS